MLSLNALVTLQEATDYVLKTGLPSRTAEEIRLLTLLINGVSEAVENYLGYRFIIRNITVITQGARDKRDRLYLPPPITWVVSMVEDGVVLLPALYHTYDRYLLRNLGASWSVKPKSIRVEYEVGKHLTIANIPPDVKLGALIWMYDLWHSGPANFSNIITEGNVMIRPIAIPLQTKTFLNRYKLGMKCITL